METISVIWLKKDLRTRDHAPLYHATHKEFPCIAIYIWEPSIITYPDFSHFHYRWIRKSLDELHDALKKYNIHLIERYGEAEDIFRHILGSVRIDTVYSHQETGNMLTYMRDINMAWFFANLDIHRQQYQSNGVIRKLNNRDNRASRWSEYMQQNKLHPKKSLCDFDYTEIQHLAARSMNSFVQEQFGEYPIKRNTSEWQPWEKYWQTRLQYFTSLWAKDYMYWLSRPSIADKMSSRLSWYLTYGNLSMRQVWQAYNIAIQKSKQELSTCVKDSKEYIWIKKHIRWLHGWQSRLHWHCHFIQKLESWPHIEIYNQNSAYNAIRHDINLDYINKRANWMTWIPLIDACMRCLQETWRIPFRMRAMVVSFICNTCMQPWQAISHILARYFLDYEPWIHYSQLQMQASTTGINTIRIYNPLKQTADKDEDLAFVRTRIPEICTLKNDDITLLWTSKGNHLVQTLGIAYPPAMIDIMHANRIAKDILWGIAQKQETKIHARKIYIHLGSRKKTTKLRQKTRTSQMQNSLFS